MSTPAKQAGAAYFLAPYEERPGDSDNSSERHFRPAPVAHGGYGALVLDGTFLVGPYMVYENALAVARTGSYAGIAVRWRDFADDDTLREGFRLRLLKLKAPLTLRMPARRIGLEFRAAVKWPPREK